MNMTQALCILSTLFLYIIRIESTQLLLFCISRHGDRSPIHKLPDEPFSNYWVNGYGQLTNIGARQHFDLGRFVRKSYSELIPESFHKKMDDFLLRMSNRCPAYTVAYNTLLNTKAAEKSLKAFKYLESVFETAFPSLFVNHLDNVHLLSTLSQICDNVIVWNGHSRLVTPTWLTDDVKQHCSALINFKHTVAYSTPQLTRLRGGPLVGHLLDLMQSRIEYELNQERGDFQADDIYHDNNGEDDAILFPIKNAGWKHRLALVAYFAHDTTLTAMMSHLGIHPGKTPPLASSLLIELHRDSTAAQEENSEPVSGTETAGFSLVFRFRNDSSSNVAHPLWPPVCGPQETAVSRGHHCPLDKLSAAMRGTYASDPEGECFRGVRRFLADGSSHSVGLLISNNDSCHFNQIAFFLLLQATLILFLLYRFRMLSISR